MGFASEGVYDQRFPGGFVMATLVRSRAYVGNIQQFRAAMQRLHSHLGAEGWSSSNGRRLVLGEYPYMQGMYHVPIRSDELNGTFSAFDWKPDSDEIASKASVKRPPTRASWQVLLWPKSSMRPIYHPTKGMYSAGIEAYEEANNRTQVRFLDGYDPERPLRRCLEIGSAFVEFCDWVIEEIWPMVPEDSGGGMGNAWQRPRLVEVGETMRKRGVWSCIKLLFEAYIGLVASIWGITEVYAYFTGDDLKAILGPNWWLVFYLLPLVIAFLVMASHRAKPDIA